MLKISKHCNIDTFFGQATKTFPEFPNLVCYETLGEKLELLDFESMLNLEFNESETWSPLTPISPFDLSPLSLPPQSESEPESYDSTFLDFGWDCEFCFSKNSQTQFHCKNCFK